MHAAILDLNRTTISWGFFIYEYIYNLWLIKLFCKIIVNITLDKNIVIKFKIAITKRIHALCDEWRITTNKQANIKDLLYFWYFFKNYLLKIIKHKFKEKSIFKIFILILKKNLIFLNNNANFVDNIFIFN